ncbi:MAG: hypothetical protein ACUVWJ_11515 [Spirochaetota bacterium]
MYGVCNTDEELEIIFFTSGNVKDNRAVADMIVYLERIFLCSAGYLLNQEELVRFFESEKRLYIATRVNMKRLMTKTKCGLFKRRRVIGMCLIPYIHTLI